MFCIQLGIWRHKNINITALNSIEYFGGEPTFSQYIKSLEGGMVFRHDKDPREITHHT